VDALWAAARRAARVLPELEGTVLRLQRALGAGTWSLGVAATHVIHDGKRRTISVAPFEDRIVHHALYASIGPLPDRHLIGDCYACRPGRGTHAAPRLAVRWARSYVVPVPKLRVFDEGPHSPTRRPMSPPANSCR